MGNEPLDHVLRGHVPWHKDDPGLTECGLPANSYPTITRDEMIAKIKREGKTRAALTSCMTCCTTAPRWMHWEDDPIEAMRRWMPHGFSQRENPDEVRSELRAIAALIDAHREEFDSYVQDIASVDDLTKIRAEKNASARYIR